MGLEKVAPGPKSHGNARIRSTTHAGNQIILLRDRTAKRPGYVNIFYILKGA
jgi:hypothetical protein